MESFRTENTLNPQCLQHKSLYLTLKLISIGLCMFLFSSCNPSLSTDEKFVGQWCYCNDVPQKNNAKTEGSRHCIASIKKVENTTESYSFNMSFLFSLTETFTKQDENTLIAVDGTDDKLKYIDSTQHIILFSHNGTGMEFSRLK